MSKMEYPVVFCIGDTVITWESFNFDFVPYVGMKIYFGKLLGEMYKFTLKNIVDKDYMVKDVYYDLVHDCFMVTIEEEYKLNRR